MVHGRSGKGKSVGACLICYRFTAIVEETMPGKTGPVCLRCQKERPTPAQVRVMMLDRIHECRAEVAALERRIREHDEIHGA